MISKLTVGVLMKAFSDATKPGNESRAQPALKRTAASGRVWALRIAIGVGFACLLGLVFLPVLTGNYGFNDDYHLLKRVKEGSFDIFHNEHLEGGRPLMGLADAVLFSIPRSIATLSRARFFSVAGIVLFALCAFAVLRRNGFERKFSAAISLLMCLTPGFAVYGSWLTDGVVPYAAAASLMAGHLIGLGLETGRLPRACGYLVFGAVLQILSYATYQPVGAFAAIALLIHAWRGFDLNWQRAKKFGLGVVCVMAVMVLYFVGFKLLASLDFGGQTERATLTNDMLGNARFVATQILWSGATGWFQFHAHWLACLTALALIAKIVHGCVAKNEQVYALRLPRFCCAALTLFICVLPMLLLAEKSFAFRTQSPLFAALALLAGFGLANGLAVFTNPKVLGQWSTILFAGWVALMAGLTHHHIDRDFVAVNSGELVELRRGLQELKDFPQGLVYIPPAQGTEPGDNIGEFQYGTAALPWVAPAMLQLLMIERFEPAASLRKALKRHEAFTVRYGPANPDSWPVLDGFTLVNGTAERINDPYWGSIRTNRNGWCCSDWFGVFDNRHFPTIYHSQLGWLWCSDKGTNAYNILSYQYGWFSTSPQTFPELWFKDQNSSFRLDPAIHPTCSFYDEARKQWTINPKNALVTGNQH